MNSRGRPSTLNQGHSKDPVTPSHWRASTKTFKRMKCRKRIKERHQNQAANESKDKKETIVAPPKETSAKANRTKEEKQKQCKKAKRNRVKINRKKRALEKRRLQHSRIEETCTESGSGRSEMGASNDVPEEIRKLNGVAENGAKAPPAKSTNAKFFEETFNQLFRHDAHEKESKKRLLQHSRNEQTSTENEMRASEMKAPNDVPEKNQKLNGGTVNGTKAPQTTSMNAKSSEEATFNELFNYDAAQKESTFREMSAPPCLLSVIISSETLPHEPENPELDEPPSIASEDEDDVDDEFFVNRVHCPKIINVADPVVIRRPSTIRDPQTRMNWTPAFRGSKFIVSPNVSGEERLQIRQNVFDVEKGVSTQTVSQLLNRYENIVDWQCNSKPRRKQLARRFGNPRLKN